MSQLGEFVYQEPRHDRLYCELLDILLKELTLNGRGNISDEVYAEMSKFDQAEFDEMVRRGTKTWSE